MLGHTFTWRSKTYLEAKMFSLISQCPHNLSNNGRSNSLSMCKVLTCLQVPLPWVIFPNRICCFEHNKFCINFCKLLHWMDTLVQEFLCISMKVGGLINQHINNGQIIFAFPSKIRCPKHHPIEGWHQIMQSEYP